MKKSIMSMAALACFAAISLSSCGDGSTQSPKTNEDSVAYYLGVAQSQGLKQYMQYQLGVDSAYLDDFIKGVKEGALNDADKKKEAYFKGLDVGKQIQQMAKGLGQEMYDGDTTKVVSVNAILSGIIGGLKGTETMPADSAFSVFQTKMEVIKNAVLEEKYAEPRKQNEAYLAKNAKAEGVTVLPSGVQYKVLVAGEGALPTDTSTVKVVYEGKLIDGTVFDSTEKQGGEPLEINMAMPRVIPGWVEVLKLMPAGSKWEVTIPQDQAYGTRTAGEIKPYSTLIFTMEVVK